MKCTYTNRHQKTAIDTVLFRRSLMKLIALSVFGMGFWISACDHGTADSALSTKIKKGSKMQSTQSNPTIETRIPVVDTVAPAETRTATFALG